MKRTPTLLASVCVCLVTVGCRDQERTVEQPHEQQAEHAAFTAQEAEGRRLYDFYCALCHGAEGTGDGFNAWNLDPRPEPFKGNALVEGVSDDDLAAVIRSGGRSVGKSVLMPPWGRTLTGPQIDALVAYLRVLVARPPEPPAQ